MSINDFGSIYPLSQRFFACTLSNSRCLLDLRLRRTNTLGLRVSISMHGAFQYPNAEDLRGDSVRLSPMPAIASASAVPAVATSALRLIDNRIHHRPKLGRDGARPVDTLKWATILASANS